MRENGGARMECFSKQISLSEILSVICLQLYKKKWGENVWTFDGKKYSHFVLDYILNTEAHGVKIEE